MTALTIDYVRQKHPQGCGPACLSMVTGEDYDAIAAQFGDAMERGGITVASIDPFLVERGWWIARKWHALDGVQRDPWPPEPWAPIHIAQVKVGGGSHFVVMHADGTVIDPAINHEPLWLSDYESVGNVTGLLPPGGAS